VYTWLSYVIRSVLLLPPCYFYVIVTHPFAYLYGDSATVTGTDASLPSILLNSHFDVVPAVMDKWSVDPWAAIEKDGWIYGRGTQDMKCVCIQYLLAICRLLKAGKKFKRTIHLSFVCYL
jgi:acetylornithine deacetylase/succinyl-diaminopimelate desuccinylase-like protein